MLLLQSTLFNALCEGTQAQAANFPFCTIEPNMGTVAVSCRAAATERISSAMWHNPANLAPGLPEACFALLQGGKHCTAALCFLLRHIPFAGGMQVPDQRLEKLAGLASSERVVPTTVEFVDIAGLVKGASKGEGLGNKFLANIRECNSIVQVRGGVQLPGLVCRQATPSCLSALQYGCEVHLSAGCQLLSRCIDAPSGHG